MVSEKGKDHQLSAFQSISGLSPNEKLTSGAGGFPPAPEDTALQSPRTHASPQRQYRLGPPALKPEAITGPVGDVMDAPHCTGVVMRQN